MIKLILNVFNIYFYIKSKFISIILKNELNLQYNINLN